jgi:(p)ppGpp synthase/HD superfamily hydrolase
MPYTYANQRVSRMTDSHKKPKQELEIEEAIVFLVNRIEESGNNPKPVILHSMRVGVYLFNHHYEPHIVKAGILHDVVEDSATSMLEVEEQFGLQIANLVEANTFDATKGDRAAQGHDCIHRCLKHGKEALIVKAADMLDNSNYVHLAPDEGFRRFWLEEMRYFVQLSKSLLRDEVVWQDLSQQYEKKEVQLTKSNGSKLLPLLFLIHIIHQIHQIHQIHKKKGVNPNVLVFHFCSTGPFACLVCSEPGRE